ncbi:hypothetical protein [Haloparvum sp. AD34]
MFDRFLSCIPDGVLDSYESLIKRVPDSAPPFLTKYGSIVAYFGSKWFGFGITVILATMFLIIGGASGAILLNISGQIPNELLSDLLVILTLIPLFLVTFSIAFAQATVLVGAGRLINGGRKVLKNYWRSRTYPGRETRSPNVIELKYNEQHIDDCNELVSYWVRIGFYSNVVLLFASLILIETLPVTKYLSNAVFILRFSNAVVEIIPGFLVALSYLLVNELNLGLEADIDYIILAISFSSLPLLIAVRNLQYVGEKRFLSDVRDKNWWLPNKEEFKYSIAILGVTVWCIIGLSIFVFILRAI